MIVTAPASSANLGPGFDCLALAVDLPFHLRVDAPSVPGPGARPWRPVEDGHPAAVAFRQAGGDRSAPLAWSSAIPPGRGLGFSGAARVAGAYAARRLAGADHGAARSDAVEVATALERHADNAAASGHGGFVVAAGGRVVRVPVPAGLAVIAWWPATTTSTDASRRVLPSQVGLADAAFSVGRAALWVAALATGDLSVLREACEDRLHQDRRLAVQPESAAVRARLLEDHRVLGAWLSGSGPTVAGLVRAADAEQVAAGVAGDVGASPSVLAVAPDGVTDRLPDADPES